MHKTQNTQPEHHPFPYLARTTLAFPPPFSQYSPTGSTRVTIAKGDNRNRDDGEDACASTATTFAHWRRAATQPVMRRRRFERRRWRVARQRRLEDERQRRRDKWGVASCNNQMAKKRSRQSREAELAAARQQVRRDNQLANKRQTGGEAYKTNGRGGVSGQEAAERREDKRRRWPAARREASRQPAGGASGAS